MFMFMHILAAGWGLCLACCTLKLVQQLKAGAYLWKACYNSMIKMLWKNIQLG
jgi:hypothetical protein